MRKIVFQGKMNAFFKAGLTALLLLCLAGSALGEIKAIRIATPSWEGQTNRDGTGLFFEIVRKVYEPAGIKMEHKIVPWKRAEKMVISSRADAMLCVASQNIGNQLAPKYPMYVDYTACVFKKNEIKEWKGLETLNGKTTVWLRGYDFHKNPHMKEVKLKKWYEIDGCDQAWSMMGKTRADVYIDAFVVIQSYTKANKIDMSSYQMETLWGENMYMAFANSERSKKLIEVYDKRIIELLRSGELKRLFEKWNDKFTPDAWQE